ncbi:MULTISPECIES: phage tail protein [unclassified Enterococcus]|uniref:phage tail protein n=1 Tax=unclassified Enterococcus TaxID=2608891 RepID=UPI003F68F5A8
MRDGWFKLGNRWSEEFNAFICERPPKKKAKRMFTLEEVSGLNKLAVNDAGYYTNIEQTLNCFYLSPTLEHVQHYEDVITEALDTRGEYVDFVPYWDPSYVYQVIVINEPNFEGTFHTLRGVPFSFDLSIAPFKKNILGMNPIVLESQDSVYNPERYPAYPKIKIYGSGNLTVSINGRETKFSDVTSDIIIDSDPDVMETYREVDGILVNEHKKLLSNQIYPYFDAGENRITWSNNVKKIVVEPRWQTKV